MLLSFISLNVMPYLSSYLSSSHLGIIIIWKSILKILINEMGFNTQEEDIHYLPAMQKFLGEKHNEDGA